MNEEKMEDVRMLEAQIEHLQTTVSALQDQLQDKQKNMTFNLGDQMQTAMSVLLCHSVFQTLFNLVFLPRLQLYPCRKRSFILLQIISKRR